MDCLLEVGPTSAGAFGPAPLSFQELQAWARTVPRGIQPFEFQFLRRLSIEWCAMAGEATDPDCPAPWNAPVTETELRSVARSLRDSISGLAQ